MRVIGLFQELVHGTALKGAPSIFDAAGKMSSGDASAVLKFLKRGCAIVDYMGTEVDVFDRGDLAKRKRIVGAASLYCDGTWIWRYDLTYYVEYYSIKLADDFLIAARQNNKHSEVDCESLLLRSAEIRAIYSVAESSLTGR